MLIGRYIGKRLGDISKLLFGGKKDLGIDGSPSGLAVSVVSNTQLNLSWTNGSTNEDGISIERSEDGVSYTEIYQTAAAATSYNNTGLTQNTNYYYRVRAFRGSVYSEYSDVVSAYTLTTDCFNYIDGLETPLSSVQVGYINTFIKALYSGLSITALSQFFDAIYILAGETAESSLRNIVKRDYDGIANNSPVFTQYEGFITPNASGTTIGIPFNPYTDQVNSKCKKDDNTFLIYYRSYGNETNNSTGYSNGINGVGGTRLRYITAALRWYAYNFEDATDPNGHYLSEKKRAVGFTHERRIGQDRIGGYNYNVEDWTTRSDPFDIVDASFYIAIYLNQVSFFLIGKYVSDADLTVIMDAFEVYMDAREKGVLS